MTGMSRSRWALRKRKKRTQASSGWGLLQSSPCRSKAIYRVKHATLLCNILRVRETDRGVDWYYVGKATRNIEVTAHIRAAVRWGHH